MDSSRRSSRAKSSATGANSSTSSNERAERATRSHQKTESPRKSTPTASLSSDPLEDKDTASTSVAEDAFQTRRKRGRADEKEKGKEKPSKAQNIPVEMDNIEEDEAVRCICGFEDYPGPPQYDEDSKDGVKEGIEDPLISIADVTEDLAGFFVQCDVCKVWQHGGCVGIQSEEQSPEEYFCEECRKDLHKIFTAPNGQHYSHYVPLFQSLSRTTSRAASFSKDGTRSPRGGSKSGRPSSSAQSAKRRSTMNSRDAAYDEEEQLRLAIAASKGAGSGDSTDGGTRRAKRGRSESEEKPEASKRQRTASASPSPTREQLRLTSQVDSDDGATTRTSGAKKIRGAAARNHREKEMREERERLRLEAKKKREGRAERRRVDDSDIGDELPPELSSHNKSPEPQLQDLPASSPVAAPGTPPTNQPPISHKKGGRPPNARKSKLGKNQYTKDRDLQEAGDKSPGRSQSRDVYKADEGHTPLNRGSISEGKPGKPKNSNSKITMADMKRRVAVMLDFISRTQLEMAAGTMSNINEEETETMMRGIADKLPMIQVNGDKGEEGKDDESKATAKEFNDMTCLEMMDILATQLVKWQKEFT